MPVSVTTKEEHEALAARVDTLETEPWKVVLGLIADHEARLLKLEVSQPDPPPIPDPDPIPPPPVTPPPDNDETVPPGESRLMEGDWDVRDIHLHGKLILSPSLDLKLRCETIYIYPTGSLIVLPKPGQRHEIVFANTPLKSPESHGIICEGAIQANGWDKDGYVRLAGEVFAGESEVRLERIPVGWKVGDKMALPDSRQARTPDQLEVHVIAAISGSVVSLVEPLKFDHLGASDSKGALDFLPHIVNLTRNVVIRSEKGSGTRGYIYATGDAEVDIQSCQLQSLGRTRLGPTTAENPTDQFPVTLKGVDGFTLIGNSIFCGMKDHEFKWGIGIRDSHNGIVKDNVLHNWAGAGLACIEGTESGNVIEGNIATLSRGKGDREGLRTDLPGSPACPGDEGLGFWFGGPSNYVRKNVAANCYSLTNGEAAYGFKYRLLNAPGIRNKPILEFIGNEVYGMENGLAVWALNVESDPATAAMSTFKDTKLWHLVNYGFYGYPMQNVCIDGWADRRDWQFLQNINSNTLSLWWGDYDVSPTLVIKRPDIQGCKWGIDVPYQGGCETTIEDGYFACTFWITNSTTRAPGAGFTHGVARPRNLTLRNITGNTDITRFTPNNREPVKLHMNFRVDESKTDIFVKDEVWWDDKQVFYLEQAADFVLPPLAGPELAGLTNWEAWEKHGKAIAGAVAPADAVTVPGITGLVK